MMKNLNQDIEGKWSITNGWRIRKEFKKRS